VATLGIPTILVYLGFLRAAEMTDQGEPFRSKEEWTAFFRIHASGVIPDAAVEHAFKVGDTSMCVLVRSLDLKWIV
jgi:hypothetical protein